MFWTTDIISARINIIDFVVFPQITNKNLKMKGNGFGNTYKFSFFFRYRLGKPEQKFGTVFGNAPLLGTNVAITGQGGKISVGDEVYATCY
jgi:hypothetical protein